MEGFPVIELLAVAVFLEAVCCWYLWRCCKKARQAFQGVSDLRDWALAMTSIVQWIGDNCCGATPTDPNWPPQDPKEFPPLGT